MSHRRSRKGERLVVRRITRERARELERRARRIRLAPRRKRRRFRERFAEAFFGRTPVQRGFTRLVFPLGGLGSGVVGAGRGIARFTGTRLERLGTAFLRRPVATGVKALAIPAAVGIAAGAPRLFDPARRFRKGKEFGESIEEKGFFGTLADLFRTPFGAGAAAGLAGLGAGIALPTAIRSFRDRDIPTGFATLPQGALPTATPLITDIPTERQITTTPKEEEKVLKPEMPSINVKVNPKQTVIVQNAFT